MSERTNLPNAIEIRPLTPNDTERARELFVAGMNSMRPGLPNETAHGDLDSYLGRCLSTDMANPYEHYVLGDKKAGFWVARTNNETVGTVAIYPVETEPNVAEAFRVSVDDRYRRLGIAVLLMEHAEKRATEQGYSTMMLQTTEYLLAAHRLYESMKYDLVKNLQYGQVKIREYRKSLTSQPKSSN